MYDYSIDILCAMMCHLRNYLIDVHRLFFTNTVLFLAVNRIKPPLNPDSYHQ